LYKNYLKFISYFYNQKITIQLFTLQYILQVFMSVLDLKLKVLLVFTLQNKNLFSRGFNFKLN